MEKTGIRQFARLLLPEGPVARPRSSNGPKRSFTALSVPNAAVQRQAQTSGKEMFRCLSQTSSHLYHPFIPLVVGRVTLLLVWLFCAVASWSADDTIEDPEIWIAKAVQGNYQNIPSEFVEKYGGAFFDYIAPYIDSSDESVRRTALQYTGGLLFQLQDFPERSKLTIWILEKLGESASPSACLQIFGILDVDEYSSDMRSRIGLVLSKYLAQDEVSVAEARDAIWLLGKARMVEQVDAMKRFTRSTSFSEIDLADENWNLYWTALCSAARLGDKSALRTAIRIFDVADAPIPKYDQILSWLAWTRQPEVLDVLIPLLDKEGWLHEPDGDVGGVKLSLRALGLALGFFDEVPSKLSREEKVEWLITNRTNRTLPPLVYKVNH